MVLSRGSSLHFKPHFDVNNGKVQSKYGAEEAKDQALHTNTIISTEQLISNHEDILIKPVKPLQNNEPEKKEENVAAPPKSKPVWKNIEVEVKQEDREPPSLGEARDKEDN